MKRKSVALTLIGIVLLGGALLAGVSQASSATTQVTAAPTGGSGSKLVDLKSVSHADDATNITWSFHTANVVTNADFDHIQWDLDLNNDGNATGQEDACIQAVAVPSSPKLRAALLPNGCGTTTAATADATPTPSASGGDDITFTFTLKSFKDSTGFSGTKYQYRVTLVDANGWTFVVPSSTTFITHTLGGSSSTPTPTPTPTATASPNGNATPTPSPTPGSSETPVPTSRAGGTSTSTDPTASPAVTGNLPQTGANILYLLVGAGALMYAGMELLGA